MSLQKFQSRKRFQKSPASSAALILSSRLPVRRQHYADPSVIGGAGGCWSRADPPSAIRYRGELFRVRVRIIFFSLSAPTVIADADDYDAPCLQLPVRPYKAFV
jgi:hypothetical protein